MTWPITDRDVEKALDNPSGALDAEDLVLYATAAMERVEEDIGPHRGQVFSSTVQGPATAVLLDFPPATITTVTVAGVAFTDYIADLGAGILTGTFGVGPIVITGTAPATVPAVVELATRELAAIWYRQNHSPRTRGGAGGAFQPLGFAIPREVSEKIAPYAMKKLPGIA